MVLTSQIIPIPRKDIDTDLIIPAEFLTTTEKKGLGEKLFYRIRKLEPNFPLNIEKYQQAKIIVAGENFGCGSSREHAAWALSDWGIKAIIAPSFADIFYSNTLKNGIILIPISQDIINHIISEEKKNNHYKIELNLHEQTITLPDKKIIGFKIDPYRKETIIKEIDDLEYLLQNMKEIEQYDKNHSSKIFFQTNSI